VESLAWDRSSRSPRLISFRERKAEGGWLDAQLILSNDLNVSWEGMPIPLPNKQVSTSAVGGVYRGRAN